MLLKQTSQYVTISDLKVFLFPRWVALFTAELFNTSPHTGIVGVLFLSIWRLFSFLISWQVEAKMPPHIRCKSHRISHALSLGPPSSHVASILLDVHKDHNDGHTWAGGSHLPLSLLYCGWKNALLSWRPVASNRLVSTTNTTNNNLPPLSSNEAQTRIIMRK